MRAAASLCFQPERPCVPMPARPCQHPLPRTPGHGPSGCEDPSHLYNCNFNIKA